MDEELNKQALSIIKDIRNAEDNGERIPLYEMTHTEARSAYLAMRNSLSPPAPKVYEIKDLIISSEKKSISARYYRGKKNNKKSALPVMVFFHGGGWVIGDLDTHDVICRQLANLGNFDVISVDYRMGPENPFPAAVEDAILSIKWVKENKENLPIDISKIIVCGDSAGGNLAAVCSIASKINFGPKIFYQVLIYPAIHVGSQYPSKDIYDEYILSQKLMNWFQEKYLKNYSNYSDWRISPICYNDLSNLPPALIIVAGCDPLRDEGIAYAKKLKKNNNKTELVIYEGQIHGFLTMGARIDDAQKLLKMISYKINNILK